MIWTKTCRYERCMKPFVSKPKAHGQRFCSAMCRGRWNFKHKYYQKHLVRPRWVAKKCKGCRCNIQVSGRGKGQSHRLYCTEGCAKNTRQRRSYARKKNAHHP